MAILRTYDAELSTVPPLRVSPRELGLRHARWMIQEMLSKLEAARAEQNRSHVLSDNRVFEHTVEKGMRWLGFIQAILWYEHVCSIEEMRDHNQPVKGDY